MTQTRENFDYEGYAIGAGIDPEMLTEYGINEQQKELLYKEAVEGFNDFVLKQITGRGQAKKALIETLNTFEDSRSILGVPEEITDVDEPYAPERVLSFLESIPEGNRDLKFGDVVNKYTSDLYDDEFLDLERPFLQAFSKDKFKERLADKLDTSSGINYDESISDVINKLRNVPEVDDEGNLMKEEEPKKSLFNRVADVAEEVSDFTTLFGKGLYNAALGTPAGALRIVDSFIPDPYLGMVQVYDSDTGLIKEIPREADDGTLISAAKYIENLRAVIPESDDLSDAVAVGIGQVASLFAGGGVVNAALKAKTKLTSKQIKAATVATTAAMGVAQGGLGGYEDYLGSIQEQGVAFDKETADAATQFGGVIGIMESIPVLKGLAKFMPDAKAPVGTLLKFIDGKTNGTVKNAFQSIGKVVDNKAGDIAVSAVTGAAMEGGQELVANLATNWVANGILKYDEERGLITDDTYKEFKVGGIIGGLMNSLMAALAPNARKKIRNRVVGDKPDIVSGPQSTVEQQNLVDGRIEPTIDDPNAPIVNEPVPNEQTPPAIRALGDKTVVNNGGFIGVGNSEAEALADLSNVLFDINDSVNPEQEYEVETEVLENKDQKTSLKPKSTKKIKNPQPIKFTGPNAETQLRALVDEVDPNDTLTFLPSNLEIVQTTEGNYNLKSGEFEASGESLQDTLRELNTKRFDVPKDVVKFGVQRETPKEPSTIEIGEGGFNQTTIKSLEGQGFTLINNDGDLNSNKVTAYKDGFVYDLTSVKSKGVNSKQVNLKVRDLDNSPYRFSEGERTQQYLIKGAFANNILNRKGDVANATKGEFVIRPPLKGIEFKKSDIANDDGSPSLSIIDAESVSDTAERIGAEIIYQSNDRVILSRGSQNIEISINEDGNFLVNTDGKEAIIDGDFQVVTTPSEVSVGAVTTPVIDSKYAVSKVTTSDIIFTNPKGEEKKVKRRSNEGEVVNIDGKEYIATNKKTDEEVTIEEENKAKSVLEELGFSNILFDAPEGDATAELDAIQAEQVVPADTQVEPPAPADNTRIVRESQKASSTIMDVSEELAKVTNVNGKPTFENKGNTRVMLDIPMEETEGALESIRVAAITVPDGEVQPRTRMVWEAKDLSKFTDMLPPHLAEMINLHVAETNPVSDRGVNGYFNPSNSKFQPAIDIDANPSKNFHDVVDTIAEEVGHFNMDSWLIPELDGLIDRMYQVVGQQAANDLPQYVARYNMDLNNMSRRDKWTLVNEYFSKQNMTFLEVDTRRVSLPPGVTQKEMKTLKQDIAKRTEKIVIDLTKDFKGDDPQQAKDFILSILKLQASNTIGDGIELSYKVAREDGTPATIEVRTTPYGSQQQVIPESQNAQRVAKIRQSMAKAISNGKWFAAINRFIIGNVKGMLDTAVGVEISTVADGLYNPKSTQTAKVYREIKWKAELTRITLDELGIGPIPIDKSYLKTFVDNGITDKTKLKHAKEMDAWMKSSRIDKNKSLGVIKALHREQKDVMTDLTRNHGKKARENLPKIHRQITLQSRAITGEWNHRTYEAYQQGGDKALVMMLAELNEGKTLVKKAFDWVKGIKGNLDDQVKQARIEIDKIGDKPTTKQIRRINDLNEIIRIKFRLKELYDWASEKTEADGKPNKATLGLMKSTLQNLIDTNQDYHVQTGSGLGDFVAALKGRTLDKNIEQDKRFMNFLGLIEDPLMVSIDNAEQQNKIINNLRYTTKMAKLLVRDGISFPIGSDQAQTLFSEGDKEVLASANAGLLNFLETDPLMVGFLKDDIAVSKAIQQGVLNQGFWGKAVVAIKADQTVMSPKLAMSNYYSNLSVLLAGGHFMYLTKEMRTDLKGGLKNAWLEQVSFGHRESDGSVADMIVKEMTEAGLLQGGSASLDAQLTNANVIETTIRGLITLSNDLGVLNNRKKIYLDKGVSKFLEGLTRFYAFGDEYSKVLPYMVNRMIGLSIAKAQTNKKDFATEQEYIDYTTKVARDIATHRTGRETNNWVIAPTIAKQLVHQRVRFVFGDYILHPLQMVRIMVENKRIIKEDVLEYNKAKKAGNEEHAAAMKKAAASRAIGNVITDATHLQIASVGTTTFGSIIVSVANMFGSDEEEVPVKDRDYLDSGEFNAGYRMSNFTNASWGGSGYQPVFREGYLLTFYDAKRLSAMNTLIGSAPATDDPSTLDYIKSTMGNFINIDNESIGLTLLNRAFRGVDRNGDELTLEGRIRETGKLFKANIVTQPYAVVSDIYSVIQDPSEDGTGRQMASLMESTGTLLGAKVVTVDVRDWITNMGWTISNQLDSMNNRNVVWKDVKSRLRSGDELGKSEIVDLVKTMVDNNNEMNSHIQYGMRAFRDYRIPNATILKHLSVNTRGTGPISLNEDLANSLLRGRNGFHPRTLKKIETMRERIREGASQSHTLSSEQIQNKLKALDDAANEYKKHIDNNKN